MQRIEHILVPTDFSAGAAAAARVAAQLARQLSAAIAVVTVVDTAPLEDAYGDDAFRTERRNAIRAEAQSRAAEFAQRHFSAIPHADIHVRDGNTYLQIMRASHDLGSNLIVMGTHGRTGLRHLLIGSVAEHVVRTSSVPVVTVRPPGRKASP